MTSNEPAAWVYALAGGPLALLWHTGMCLLVIPPDHELDCSPTNFGVSA